jgi:hypothetical protein
VLPVHRYLWRGRFEYDDLVQIKEVKQNVISDCILDIDVALARTGSVVYVAKLQVGWHVPFTFHHSGYFRMESFWSSNSLVGGVCNEMALGPKT